MYFNYKGTFSIVLLAVVDPEYRFLAVDIGQHGSCSDGGVFRRSALGQALEANQLNLPGPAPLPNASDIGHLPHYTVGDEAFLLETFLL